MGRVAAQQQFVMFLASNFYRHLAYCGDMKRLIILVVVTPLVACGTSPEPTPSESVTTVVETHVESVEKPAAAPHTPPPTASPRSPSDLTREELSQLLIDYPGENASYNLGDVRVTNCVYGDGYGLHMVAAGPNTSCDFAREVMKAQTENLNATEQNVRHHLHPVVSVTSPVTGLSYDMKCANEPNFLIRCTGGNDATVFMF